jgi:uncharacterized protein (TIGR02266 family)
MGEPQRDRLAAAALKVKYKCTSTDEFIRLYSNDISLFGIFINTKVPLQEGLTVHLELQLKDGSPVVRGIGRVDWRREVAQSEDRPAGMGIKFLKLDETSREVVERAVDARGVTPSRFIRLKAVTPRPIRDSEQPAFPRTNTLIGIRAPSVFNSKIPSSPPPASDALKTESSPRDSRPPKFSFTRVKTVSVPSPPAEPRASTSEHPESVKPPISSPPTFTEPIPQRDTKFIRTISSAFSFMTARGNTGEHKLPPERTKYASLRERLAKHAAANPFTASADKESALRLARLAELSKAEIEEYTIPRPFLVLTRLLFPKRQQ